MTQYLFKNFEMLDPELQNEAEVLFPAVVVAAFLHLVDADRFPVAPLYHWIAVLDPGAKKKALPHPGEGFFEGLFHHPPSPKLEPPSSLPNRICCCRTPAEVSG